MSVTVASEKNRLKTIKLQTYSYILDKAATVNTKLVL